MGADRQHQSEDDTRPGAPAEPTYVVTSFLMRQDRGHDELLLVRRSDRVRTYRGHWAGISGYLEPGVTPVAQAYTEIAEETRLSGEDITLLRTGAPLRVEDAEQGLSWVVYPFLFGVSRPERVRTDWEARELRWIAPAALGEYPTVPGLAAALACVYAPPAPAPGAEPDNG